MLASCMSSFLFIFYFPFDTWSILARSSCRLLTNLLFLPVRSTLSSCLHPSQIFCILQKDAISPVSRLNLLYWWCDLGMGLASYGASHLRLEILPSSICFPFKLFWCTCSCLCQSEVRTTFLSDSQPRKYLILAVQIPTSVCNKLGKRKIVPSASRIRQVCQVSSKGRSHQK